MATLWTCLLSTIVFFIIIFSGRQVDAVPYDHSYTHECLAKPLEPQYGGGLVVNPEMNNGLEGWTTLGDAKLEHFEHVDGNKYIVASDRKRSDDSFAQKFNLEKDKLYTFSAWLQVSNGDAHVAAVFRTEAGGKEPSGWVVARKGCWSMLKGGISVNTSGPAVLYFESNNTAVDIWADSISLQPFTQEEWKSHQEQSIEKVRKSKVKFQAVDQHGQPIPNATITFRQLRRLFPVGCAMNSHILYNQAYQLWFSSRFRYTVFENEMKWYSTEKSFGKENYTTPDNMVQFCKKHGIQIRGHNVFWDDVMFQPSWVPYLPTPPLYFVTNKRINSVMKRYWGQLIHWDVVNENLHTNFLESRLGPTASTMFYKMANQIDGRAIPFLNEYNTIEQTGDATASPARYLQKIWEIREGYNGPLGIGLEGHFTIPNFAYIRSSLDMLGSAKLPIWITELDLGSGPNQAKYLDQLLRELKSHWAVQGIMIWSAWNPKGCYRMCLTDSNFRNLPTGDVVDNFLRKLSHADLAGTTDSQGFFETSLFHGEYEAEITHPKSNNSSPVLHNFEVGEKEEVSEPLRFRVSV